MESASYTLRDIARELNLPESTIRYYRDLFALYIPTEGMGRRRRYPAQALDLFRIIADGYSQNLAREEIEARVQGVAPALEVPPQGTRPTPLRLHRQAPVASQPTDQLVATIMDGERERRDVMWQLAREIVRMGEVLERQQVALVQISQQLDGRALMPGTSMTPVPYASEVPAPPAAPEESALAQELHLLREELTQERELVERLRRSKLEIERRATAAEAELEQRAESPDVGALRRFLSKDR